MKLSVIVPVYNERATIGDILNRVRAADFSPFEKEIVVVDDCSKDGTRELLPGLVRTHLDSEKLVYHDVNQGKGAAIRTGLSAATGDYLVIQDADLEYDPNEIPGLCAPILAGEATVVYGSRFLGRMRRMTFRQWVGNKGLTVLTNVLYGASLTDMETCYKVMPAAVVKSLNLRAQRFDFEPEVTAKLLKRGERIVELPISYSARADEEGKKISWKDGFPAVWALLKYRVVE